jgi:hypothetical protein
MDAMILLLLLAAAVVVAVLYVGRLLGRGGRLSDWLRSKKGLL